MSLPYFKEDNRAARADNYMDSISAVDYDYTHIANIAFLFEPELATRLEYKKMSRAILAAISYALYYGKRNVQFQGFGKITSDFVEHRDRNKEKGIRGRKQKWKWKLVTRYNTKTMQNGCDLVRHMKDAKRMKFIEPRNYKQESWERYQKKILDLFGLDVYTFLEIPKEERRILLREANEEIYRKRKESEADNEIV